MGWLFTQGQTRPQLIARLTRTETNADTGRTRICLSHCIRGNVLWTVWTIRNADGSEHVRYIGCDLMAKEFDYGWGYKDLEESSYPYYFSCPLSYLDMVPEACPEWRAQVRRYNAMDAMSAGDKVVFSTPMPLTNGERVSIFTLVNKKKHHFTYGQGRHCTLTRTAFLEEHSILCSAVSARVPVIKARLQAGERVPIAELYADEEWRLHLMNVFQAGAFDWDGFYPVVREETGTVTEILPADSVPEGAVWLNNYGCPARSEHDRFAIDAASV
jgi:hypothetical protein